MFYMYSVCVIIYANKDDDDYYYCYLHATVLPTNYTSFTSNINIIPLEIVPSYQCKNISYVDH